MKLEIKDLNLTLGVNWKIARGATREKENLQVIISDKEFLGHSEVAFNIRYGENKAKILEEFGLVKESLTKSKEDFLQILDQSSISNSLRFAIESAYFDYLADKNESSISSILRLNSKMDASYPTSFSIPIMAASEAVSFIREKNLARFSSLKIKIDKENNTELVHAIMAEYKGLIRIDGNECFLSASEVMNFIGTIATHELSRVQFIEQPLPSNLQAEIVKLKEVCPLEIIADESITNNEVSDYLCKGFHGVNLKLMKTGGLRQFKAQIEQARKLKLKIMIGCMIETSLAISYALYFAHEADYLDLDGFLLIKEDPFEKVTEKNGLLRLNLI